MDVIDLKRLVLVGVDEPFDLSDHADLERSVTMLENVYPGCRGDVSRMIESRVLSGLTIEDATEVVERVAVIGWCGLHPVLMPYVLDVALERRATDGRKDGQVKADGVVR